MRRSIAIALIVSLGSLGRVSGAYARPAPAQAQAAGLAAVVLGLVNDVATAVNLTDDQKTSIKKIADAHRDEFLTARANGDVATLREIVRGAAQEIAAVLTREQVETAKSEIKKALADRGLPALPF